MANSRPSMRYVLIHSLNRPRFTVCPGQTWNVPPILNENLMPCHRPDWHGQTCQSGLWRSSDPEDGSYAYLGAFNGVFSGNNTTGKQFKIYVWGGNPPPRKINFGNSDNCANTFSLTASVGGLTVANSVDGNSEWHKSGSFSFDVPNGASFSITSNGMMAYGCDYGTFSVFRYH